MKWLVLLALLSVIAGVCLVAYANTLPLYTDWEARDQLSSNLRDLDRDTRFKEWYLQLSALETPHKKWADLGRGLAAAGLGLMALLALIAGYNRHAWIRKAGTLFLLWFALWLVRIPLTYWFYQYRSLRGDYPSWGDTIIIPIASEVMSWVMGAFVFSFILMFLLSQHALPERLFHFPKPRSLWGWTRAVIISLWLMLNALLIYEGIPYGDEGTVFSCLVASAILAIILAANPAIQPGSPPEVTGASANPQPEG